MSRNVLSIGARLSKLRAMSAAEILHRLRYKALLDKERRQQRAGTLVDPERLRHALAPSLQGPDWERRLLASRLQNRARLFPSVGDRDALRALFAGAYAREREDTVAQAAAARAHRFAFFGEEFTYGPDVRWTADPVSGREWPHVFHADVPVHGGDVGHGDVKHVWELSRHQFLMDLGKSWFLTGERADVDALRALVRSWIAANPYGTGVNWACALEPAFRVFSWLWTYSLTADALDDEFHLEWLRSFLDHGRFIERHFEHYSSPYNHLMGEAAALYMLGVYFPEFKDAPRWRSAAATVMTTRLGEQFYDDGGSVEQSTFYHHATVGFFLLAAMAARASGEPMPSGIWPAIERGLDFSLALTQPDGFTPRIGGADDGKPIRLEHLPFWDFRPYLAVGAVLFERPDFKYVAGRFHEDALWLLGPDGLREFERLRSTPPADVVQVRPASGYYVLRGGWSSQSDYVCFDCGEQAAGMRTDNVPNSMHGHADCLSLVAWLEGRAVLMDSGLFSYNAGGAWEAHFRETAAHSTARVDGRDQALHIGKMAWSNSYRAVPEGWHADDRHQWVVGSHDGYARGPDGVRHRRAVWLRPGSWLAIYDEFTGSGAHTYDVHYQFAPGVLAERDGGLQFEDHVEVAWASDTSWRATLACGGDGPAEGWLAPSLGVRVPAPRVTLTCQAPQPPVRLLTVFAPRGDGRRLLAVPDAACTHLGAAAAVAVAAAGRTDLIVVPAAAAAAIVTDAMAAAVRVPHSLDAPLELDRIGGHRLEADDEALRRLIADWNLPGTPP
jgi:hypothetical protein